MRTFNDYEEDSGIGFTRLTADENNPWCGHALRDISIPKDILILLILRRGEAIVPSGSTVVETGDVLVAAAPEFKGKDEFGMYEEHIGTKCSWLAMICNNFKGVNVPTILTDNPLFDYVGSDFIDQESFKNSLMIANRKHDVVAIQVYDRRVEELPAIGLMKIKDAETGHEQWIDTSSRAVRRAHHDWWVSKQTELNETFTKSNVDNVSVRTDQDYVKALMNLFAKRN